MPDLVPEVLCVVRTRIDWTPSPQAHKVLSPSNPVLERLEYRGDEVDFSVVPVSWSPLLMAVDSMCVTESRTISSSHSFLPLSRPVFHEVVRECRTPT